MNREDEPFKKYRVKPDFADKKKYPSRNYPIVDTMRELAGEIIELKPFKRRGKQYICKRNYQWILDWVDEVDED